MYQQQLYKKKGIHYKSVVAVLCVFCSLLLVADVGLICYILQDKSYLQVNKAYENGTFILNTIANRDLSTDEIANIAQTYKDNGLITDFETLDDHILMDTADGVTYLFTTADTKTENNSNLTFSVVDPFSDAEATKKELSVFESVIQGQFIFPDGPTAYTHRFGTVFRTNLRVDDKSVWKQYAKEIKNKEMIAGRTFFWICPSYFRSHLQTDALRDSVLFVPNALYMRDNRLLKILFEKGLGLAVVIDPTLDKTLQNELSALFRQKFTAQNEDGTTRTARKSLQAAWEQFCQGHPAFSDIKNTIQLHFPDGANDFRLRATDTKPQTTTNEATQDTTQDALTLDEAKKLITDARAVFQKWMSGADFKNSEKVTIDDYDHYLVPYTKDEIKAEVCKYMHESYFEKLFDCCFIEQDGKIYYYISEYNFGTYSILNYTWQAKNNTYTITMNALYRDSEAGIGNETITPYFEFIYSGGKWIIAESDIHDLLFFCSLQFIPENVTQPALFITPQAAFVDTADDSSVKLRKAPDENAQAIDATDTITVADNEKIHICGTDEKYPDWVFVSNAENVGWLPANIISDTAQLTKENIINIFTTATALYRDWISQGPSLDTDTQVSYTVKGQKNQYAKVYTSNYTSVEQIKNEFAKYFSADLYEDSIDKLYTMINRELYGVTTLGTSEDIYSADSITLTILSQSEDECSFSVTQYYWYDGESKTNTYTLKKINNAWVFTEKFDCINITYKSSLWES